jgi:hypothetical protein
LYHCIIANSLYFLLHHCTIVQSSSSNSSSSSSSPYSSLFFLVFTWCDEIFAYFLLTFLTIFRPLVGHLFLLMELASCCNNYSGINFIYAVPTSLLIAPGFRTIQFLLLTQTKIILLSRAFDILCAPMHRVAEVIRSPGRFGVASLSCCIFQDSRAGPKHFSALTHCVRLKFKLSRLKIARIYLTFCVESCKPVLYPAAP